VWRRRKLLSLGFYLVFPTTLSAPTHPRFASSKFSFVLRKLACRWTLLQGRVRFTICVSQFARGCLSGCSERIELLSSPLLWDHRWFDSGRLRMHTRARRPAKKLDRRVYLLTRRYASGVVVLYVRLSAL
jgi:hypothetical protein